MLNSIVDKKDDNLSGARTRDTWYDTDPLTNALINWTRSELNTLNTNLTYYKVIDKVGYNQCYVNSSFFHPVQSTI